MSSEDEMRNYLIDRDFYFNQLEKEWKMTRVNPNSCFKGLKNPLISSELLDNIDNLIRQLVKDRENASKEFMFLDEAYKELINSQISKLKFNKAFLLSLNVEPKEDEVTEDDIQEVKQIEMIRLVEFFGLEYTNSKPPKCLCPFHDEKTPSLAIYDNSFFCFGCQKSGDTIEFYKQLSGCSFFTAVRELKGFL